MKTENTPAVLSDTQEKEVQAKVAELEAKNNGKKVYPIIFVRPGTGEIFVGYILEPSRAAKMEAFDIMSTKDSISLAGEMILSAALIKEESHEAFSSTDSKYDDVVIGACVDCLQHIKVLVNALKKK